MENNEVVQLVVGADGLIGGAIARRASRQGTAVVATSRRPNSSEFQLDLADPPRIWMGPPVSVVYLCAALTKLDSCERDPAGSARINVEGTLRFAELMRSQGAFAVFFSTNHVFDGSRPRRRTDEMTCPINEYGRQKALAERQLLASGNAAVIRLTKVIGPSVPLFDHWIEAVSRGEPIQPFVDMSLAPVKLERVVEAACRVAELRAAGIHHLSGDVDLSYFETARIGLEALGFDTSLATPGTYRRDGLVPPAVPQFTSLDLGKVESLLIEPLETSQQTVKDYFMRLAA